MEENRHKIPDYENDENAIRIESVGGFLNSLKTIRENNETITGESTELFFRGQETEFWKIEPSIFRDDMLSIEHKLMSKPLQKYLWNLLI